MNQAVGVGGEVPVEVRAASTVTLMRQRDDIEVYLLQRRPESVFVPDVHVFPGGAVDRADHALVEAGLTTGPTESDASLPMGLGSGGLAYRVASIRETLEETGVLFAAPAEGGLPVADHGALAEARQRRREVDNDEVAFADVLGQVGLRAATDQLHYFAHWVTPEGAPRRYDTRFFVAECPGDQEPDPDGVEAVSGVWMRPVDAIEANLTHEIDLILPTYRVLVALSRFDSVSDAIDAIGAHGVRPDMGQQSSSAASPGRMVEDGGGFRVPLPGGGPESDPFPPAPPMIRARRGTDGRQDR